MSFTSDVKAELIKNYSKAAHCRAAEAAGMLMIVSAGRIKDDKPLRLSFDDENAAGKCHVALSKTFGINAELLKKTKGCEIVIDEDDIARFKKIADPDILKTDGKLLERTCCKRAFLRGAFLAGGTVSNPEKNYHFEIACQNRDVCVFIKDIAGSFDIPAKISARRERYIMYIKEAADVSDMLNVIEAHVALMDFENIRIVREMRGNVNRKVNCDTANIEKTVKASMKQIEEINYINETIGLESLNEGLEKMARVRLENPDVPLAVLGEMMDPPIGKSGVNHRMRKLSLIAGQIYESREKIK